jgi:hypothetical protein
MGPTRPSRRNGRTCFLHVKDVARSGAEVLNPFDIADDLQHALRSARAAGHQVIVIPARCRSCGFIFDEEKLSKALDAWTESVSALATWIRYSPPPPDAKPVEPWFDDEPDDDGGPETMH